MKGWSSRYGTAAICVLLYAVAGCGGGGGAQPAGIVPALNAVKFPASSGGPVGYMQNSGPLTSSGSIVKGSSAAMVAVMSGVAQSNSAFSADTLTVSGAATQTSVRATMRASSLQPAHARPPEAFAPGDEALLSLLRAHVRGSQPGAHARQARAGAVSSNAVPGSQASIWVQQGGYNSRTNLQVPATLLAQSAHGNIWVQSTLLPALAGDAAQLAADFENGYSSDTAHFASPDYPADAPGMQPQYTSCSSGGSQQGNAPAYIAEPADRRINVMIVDSTTLGGLGGYFSAANLMTQGALNCLNAGYESNEAPFIFVGWFSGYGAQYELQEDAVRSTAHELQHLINFVNHSILAPGAATPSFNGNEAQYLNEGLSMLAQDFAVAQMYGAQGVQFDAADALARAQAYLSDPAAYSISAFSGIDPPAWGGDGSSARNNCSGGCYGGAYLFARYLHDRFGEGFTHSMETSGTTGAANLQSVTGENPGDLLGDFALAMAADTLGVSSTDSRFAFGSLGLKSSYTDQFGGKIALEGINTVQSAGASTTVHVPVGGFAFVALPSVPAGGMSVQVTDEGSVSGFALLGGLAQH